MPQDQILRACRSANRIGLHEAHSLKRTVECGRFREIPRDSESSQVVDSDRLKHKKKVSSKRRKDRKEGPAHCAWFLFALASTSLSIFLSDSRSRCFPLSTTPAILRVLPIFSSGLASSKTRSASLPFSTVPSERSRRRKTAGLTVAV